MRGYFLDQFTYLHFAVGIIFYFWGFSLKTWFILHTLYEIGETTPFGSNIINKYFGHIWPGGGKHKAEPIINGIGDTIGSILGWLSAYYLDTLGNNYGWYPLHINN